MLDSIKQKLEQINLIEVTKYKKAGVLILLLNDIETNKIQILIPKDHRNYLLILERLVFQVECGKKKMHHF